MDYIKIRFTDDFGEISSELEKTFEDLFRPTSTIFTLSVRKWRPPIDMYETFEEIIILADIAGVNKEDLGVEISNKAVKIYGERMEVSRLSNTTFRLAEIQYGKFERILFLPVLIDTDVVSASYSNGFLQVRLAKLPTDKTYKIPIADG